MNWMALIQAIIGTEQALIPIIIPHPDPTQNKIVGIVMASEAATAAILNSAGVIPPPPNNAAQ